MRTTYFLEPPVESYDDLLRNDANLHVDEVVAATEQSVRAVLAARAES